MADAEALEETRGIEACTDPFDRLASRLPIDREMDPDPAPPRGRWPDIE
jgi:hypothetical protein